MAANPSLWSFIIDAGPVVKLVMLLLLAASIISWTFILQKSRLAKQIKQDAETFQNQFWSGMDLNELYNQHQQNTHTNNGLAQVFTAGFKQFQQMRQLTNCPTPIMLEATERAMLTAQTKALAPFEQHLPTLATIGSTSPYVGLFGTVWGIMTAFQSLGSVQQATIAMVAPGISEALIATAIGLFAAIPAVIAYNRFSHTLTQLHEEYAVFTEEFITILQQQLYHATPSAQPQTEENPA